MRELGCPQQAVSVLGGEEGVVSQFLMMETKHKTCVSLLQSENGYIPTQYSTLTMTTNNKLYILPHAYLIHDIFN